MSFSAFPIATQNASTNPYPKVILVKGSAPGAAASGQLNLFADTADAHVKVEDESGNIRDLQVMQEVVSASPATPINGTLWFLDDAGTPATVSAYYRKGGVTYGPFPLFTLP